MKYLLSTLLLGVMLTFSQCNETDESHDTDMENTESMNEDGSSNMADMDNSSDGNSSNNNSEGNMSGNGDNVSEEEMGRTVLFFNYDNIDRAEIDQYRKAHDETDWGTTPGYFPEASTRQLTQDDVKYLTEWGHMVMLNEIYARHGKRFDKPELKQHFATQDWYTAENDNVSGMLSTVEKNNVVFLQNNKPS